MPSSSSSLNEESVLKYLQTHHPDLADAMFLESPSFGSLNGNGSSSHSSQSSGDVKALLTNGLQVPQIPNFNLRRIIGRGGFGTVWLARNVHDRHLYAVKVLGENRSVELAGIREFKSRAASNPFLVSISHVGEADGIYYYVMPLADDASENHVIEIGEYRPMTLDAYVYRTGGLDPERIEQIATRLLLGLERLHETGSSHNDIKPSNILRVSGTWQLGDPGLMTAVAHREDGRGTREYWPEPEDGVEVDGKACDLFALGKTMQYMLTGSLDKPATEDKKNELHDRLARCIGRACEPKSSNRFRSVRQMRAALKPRRSRNALLALATCLVLATGLAWHAFQQQKLGNEPQVMLPFAPDKSEAIVAFETFGTSKGAKSLAPTKHRPGLVVTPITIGPGLIDIKAQNEGKKELLVTADFADRFAPRNANCHSLLEAIESGDYLKFAVTIEDGAWLDLQAIQAYLFTHDKVPRNFALLTSIGGFTAEQIVHDFEGVVTAPTTKGQELRLVDLRENNEFRELTGTVEFRIYMYGASGSEYLVAGLGQTEGYELTLFGDLHGTEAEFVSEGLAKDSDPK